MKRTLRTALVLALMAGATLPVHAGEEAAKALETIETKYDESKGNYAERAAAVKADYEAFITAHKGTDEALTALLFLLQSTWWEREAGTMNESAGKLVERILADHAESPRLDELVRRKYVLSTDQRAEVFGKLRKLSPHESVQAEALLAMALSTKDAEAKAASLQELKTTFGTAMRRGLTPYAEVADAHLNRHDPAKLVVGEKAPEIVGRDLDGNPMKLSDYAGKVVVLDFWGDW